MSFIPDNYPQVRRFSYVFAKNKDGKFSVFFANHQKNKDLFDDQATPWLDSMEKVFAWKALFRFEPADGGIDGEPSVWYKGHIFEKLSDGEISRLSILGSKIICMDSTIRDLAERVIVDYDDLAQPLK